jgi:hypothetical protein
MLYLKASSMISLKNNFIAASNFLGLFHHEECCLN